MQQREIKLRAWDKEDQRWIEAEPIYGFFPSLPMDKWNGDRYGNIQQFTGLHDKNGKEIYEGDIIILSHMQGSPKAVITWLRDAAHFVAVEEVSDLAGWSLFNGLDEVIGNIYETPELLK